MKRTDSNKTQELLEILRNFRLLDDTFFSQCFDGNTECTGSFSVSSSICRT